jgi:uncharacterized Tic20 family protein
MPTVKAIAKEAVNFLLWWMLFILLTSSVCVTSVKVVVFVSSRIKYVGTKEFMHLLWVYKNALSEESNSASEVSKNLFKRVS